jgi:hypothetical protein
MKIIREIKQVIERINMMVRQVVIVINIPVIIIPAPNPRNVEVPSSANPFVLFSIGCRSIIIEFIRGITAPNPIALIKRDVKNVKRLEETLLKK